MEPDYLRLTLRFIHIVGGSFWVGAALLMNFFIGPTIRATGDAGKQFAGHFMSKTKFSAIMNVTVFATIIAGFWLYGLDSNGFKSVQWMSAGFGRTLGIGAVFAMIGFVTGFMNGMNNMKLAKLGAQIQGKPTPEQAATLAKVSKQQAWVVPVNSYSLLLAIIIMATARYL